MTSGQPDSARLLMPQTAWVVNVLRLDWRLTAGAEAKASR